IFWPWGVLLLWPAIALGIVAIAYFRAGPIVFHKTEGTLPWSTRFVLAPCLLGQYLSLLYYRRQCRSWDKVTPQIWIGGKLGCRSANKALCSGVVSVLDLSAEFSEAKPFRKIIYRNIPVLDLTAPTQAQLVETSKFICNHSRNGAVYVHCKIGYSRSAAAVAAYLIMSGEVKTAEEAFAMIRRVRPSVVIRPEVLSALSDTTRQRFATIQAIKQFDSSGTNAASSKQARDLLEPTLTPATYNSVRATHVTSDILTIAALWAMELRRRRLKSTTPAQ